MNEIIISIIHRVFDFFPWLSAEAWTALATVSIAVFTIVLVLVTNRQARLTKEALITNSRAFIFVEDFTPTFVRYHQSGRWTIKDLVIKPLWKNSGDTPPKNLTLNVNYEIVEGDLSDDFRYSYSSAQISTLIGPKSTEWSNAIIVPDADFQKSISSGRHLYIWGRADYKSVFESKRSCFTEFCYKVVLHRAEMQPELQFVAHGKYNRSDHDIKK